MRILHLSKYYAPIEGGIETVCHDVIETIQKHSHVTQCCLCFNTRPETSIDYQEHIPIIRAGCFIKLFSQSLSFCYFFLLKRILKSYKPDYLHVHLPNPLVYLCLLMLPKNYKLILHWHSDIIEQKLLYFLIRPLEQTILKMADVILVTSEPYLKHSVALKKWHEKCIVVPNTVDMPLYVKREGDDEAIDKIRRKYNNRKIVFFVGRHVKYKGLNYLLEAEKYVKEDCVFVIAGRGPETIRLQQQYHSTRLFFIGRITNDEVRQYYYAATILAFPSISKNEAFGMVLAEALTCNLPAVTFTIPGSGVNVVSVDGKTGIEVKKQDAILYAEAIDTLLRNEELRRQFSSQCHNHIKNNFSKELLPDLLYNIYQW